MWSLEKPEIVSTACSLPGFSERLCAVSWDSPRLSPFARYFKTSLSQRKCEAQRSMWVRYEGKILGMLFVTWPGSFPTAVISKVYVKFELVLCLYSSDGILAWEWRAVTSLESLCPFPCTVLFCDPCLPILKVQYKSTIFNFPVLIIPASLEDSEFSQSTFFSPQTFLLSE